MTAKIKSLRQKHRKIAITESDAREFLKLSAEATICLFDVTYIREVPSLQSLVNAFLPMKVWLAKKLAANLSEVVAPEAITSVKVEVITFGGYFMVSFDQAVSTGETMVRQPWSISFSDPTKLPTIMKLSRRFPPPKDQEFNLEMLETVINKL